MQMLLKALWPCLYAGQLAAAALPSFDFVHPVPARVDPMQAPSQPLQVPPRVTLGPLEPAPFFDAAGPREAEPWPPAAGWPSGQDCRFKPNQLGCPDPGLQQRCQANPAQKGCTSARPAPFPPRFQPPPY